MHGGREFYRVREKREREEIGEEERSLRKIFFVWIIVFQNKIIIFLNNLFY